MGREKKKKWIHYCFQENLKDENEVFFFPRCQTVESLLFWISVELFDFVVRSTSHSLIVSRLEVWGGRENFSLVTCSDTPLHCAGTVFWQRWMTWFEFPRNCYSITEWGSSEPIFPIYRQSVDLPNVTNRYWNEAPWHWRCLLVQVWT